MQKEASRITREAEKLPHFQGVTILPAQYDITNYIRLLFFAFWLFWLSAVSWEHLDCITRAVEMKFCSERCEQVVSTCFSRLGGPGFGSRLEDRVS
jgi:hypothetical protein